jgi:phosphoglycerate dehydrogenase-like enzyme
MTLHIHAVNDPELDAEQFHVSEDQLRAACPPGLAGAVTFSAGGTGDVDTAAGADVLIGWTFPREMLERTPEVSWLHVIGAGVDHLEPLDWVPSSARLTNSSGVHAAKAAEFVAAGLLMLNSKMLLHLEEQQAHRWTPRYSTVITGKTILIVGVGTIGGAVARRAKELGLVVRGVRRSGAEHPDVDQMFRTGELVSAIAGADFVVVCAALTPDTRGLIDADALALLPDDAGLINVAREPIVDYDALAGALRDGRLGGAILDVFEPEPLDPESALWDCPRLLVTPHVSSDPLDYTVAMLEIFMDNLARFIAQTPLRNEISLPGQP